jgi:FtsP/CotA-like multicopper oxidase with cupredoxin domain
MKVQASSFARHQGFEREDASGHLSAETTVAWQTPQTRFERRMFTDGMITMPDACDVGFWGFQDPADLTCAKSMFAPVIRVREGSMVHVKIETPALPAVSSALNRRAGRVLLSDAVSVQKTESFIYQWQPQSSGTWLYQSHLSSLAHFEMGLFGLMIVEPPLTETGRRLAYRGGPEYTIERSWVLDDIDPSWHSGQPTEIDRPFNPQYFLVNGIPNLEAEDHKDVAIEAGSGDKILVRVLNASFSLVRIHIEGLRGHIIAIDGKALASDDRPWTRWVPIAPDKPVLMTSGARRDLLIDLDPLVNAVERGRVYRVVFEFLDWEKRTVRNADASNPVYRGKAVTRIKIT